MSLKNPLIRKANNWGIILTWRGRRASCVGRSRIERGGGQRKSENAGMSSEKYVRIILAENLRDLGEGSSAPKWSGAKARPKGVVDAQTVNIPLPLKFCTMMTS